MAPAETWAQAGPGPATVKPQNAPQTATTSSRAKHPGTARNGRQRTRTRPRGGRPQRDGEYRWMPSTEFFIRFRPGQKSPPALYLVRRKGVLWPSPLPVGGVTTSPPDSDSRIISDLPWILHAVGLRTFVLKASIGRCLCEAIFSRKLLLVLRLRRLLHWAFNSPLILGVMGDT